MSNLTDYAKDELTRAGLFDKDSDYDGMLGTAALEIIEVFAKQGHSGMSASPLWQNKRKSTTFSVDGGKTHYDLDDDAKAKNGVTT